MPLPTPNPGESRDDFISRCISDETIQNDFDDQDQRLAVCNSQWEKAKMFDLDYELKEPSEQKTIWFDEFQIGATSKEMPSGDSVDVANFSGIANVMEHEDLGGDIVHKGAFKKTLQEKNGKVYFVTDHNYKISNYGGVANLSEDGDKLNANVEVLLSNNPEGKEFHTKAQHAASHGLPFGLSIGYDVPEGKAEMKDGIRHIYEVKLWEVSGVLFPMNELSRAVGFKGLHKYSRTDLNNVKDIIDSLLQKGESLARALNNAIEDMAGDDTSRADIIQDMADEAGISPNTVNNILSGDIIRPPDERLRGFARVLDISFDRLQSLAESDAGKAIRKMEDIHNKLRNSLLYDEPPQSTHNGEADIIKQLDKLKPENYER